MFLSVEPGSPVPMYRQLMDQIRFAAASGRLAPGERLPGVREMAEKLQINLQTVVRAYADLVREGVLEMRRGLGTYVAERPAGRREGRPTRELDARVRTLCREAYALGLSRDELKRMITEAWGKEAT